MSKPWAKPQSSRPGSAGGPAGKPHSGKPAPMAFKPRALSAKPAASPGPGKERGKPPPGSSRPRSAGSGPRKDAGDKKGPRGAGGGDKARKHPKAAAKPDPEKVRADRKLSKPHHELVESLVLKWNELRERKTPLERRQVLVAEVVAAVRGKVNEIILRHDASRVVQGCIKCGTTEQKRAICEELYGHILRLTKSKHGYHIPERMIRHGGQAVRDRVLTELKGNFARLLTHNLGSVVVQAGFSHGWTAAQCWDAYQELYGPEYVYFKAATAPAPQRPGAPAPAPSRSLGAILAAHPEKRRPILLAMFQTLSKQTDKGLLSLPVAQRLLLEYLQHAPPEQVVHMVSAVRGHVLSLLASREGARAAALCFAYGAPKERKLMLRLLKGHMPDIACHDHGHMVLVAALAFTDDTRTSGSLIFDELRPHLAYIACHHYGRKVLLALLAPRDSRYFAPSDLEMLAPVHLPAYLASRKVETPAAPGDKDDDAAAAGAAAGKTKGKGGAAPAAPAAAAADTEDAEAAAGAAAVAAKAGLGPRKHLLPLEPTPEQQRDAALMAPTPTSKKPEAIKTRELIAALRTDLEGVLLSRTSLLARSPEAAAVLQEAAVRLNSPELWAAIADLTASEPSPEELAGQVMEMNAAARAASYAAQSRVRLAGASAEASGAAAPPPGAAGSKPPAAAAAAAAPAASAKAQRFDAADMNDGEDEGGNAEGEEDEEMDGGEDDEEEDEEEGDDDEGEEDGGDEDDEDDDDEESGGEEEEAAAPLPRLPVFEDPASHMLFKRLLHREAAPQPDRPGGAMAGQKRRRGDEPAAAGGAAAAAPPPADAVLGRLLVERIAGSLAGLASSNRACFVLLELLHSADAAVAGAVRSELVASRAALAAQPDCAGKAVLLQALAPPAAAAPAAPTPARPAASASKPPAKAAATPAAAAAASAAPASASAAAGRSGGGPKQKAGGEAAAPASAAKGPAAAAREAKTPAPSAGGARTASGTKGGADAAASQKKARQQK